MNGKHRQPGFSLIETMLAIGTLAIGMVFVAGTFMAGVYFASVSTERTIANVVTDEALAKIVLYGLDPNDAKMKVGGFVPYEDIRTIAANEFLYPSASNGSTGQYSWSAVCRREHSGSRLVEFTVFVSRLVGPSTRYWVRGTGSAWPQLQQTDLPHPVLVNVVRAAGMAANELSVKDAVSSDTTDESTFLDEGSIIVDDATGQIYRVLQRYAATPDRVRIDPSWPDDRPAAPAGVWVWTVPRPVSGGRNPLVAVYQKVIGF